MGYEIDFMATGTEKSGDAIALRFGNLHGTRDEQTVVVIDGGFTETGADLVNHIDQHYNTKRVDLVISTHPDGDHAAGLKTVLEQCEVGALWMHRPWNHTEDIAKMFVDGRVTDASVTESLRKSLEDARSLERLATSKRIPIIEPFVGLKHSSGQVLVLGPTLTYYESLLPGFRATPEPKQQVGLFAAAVQGVGNVITKVAEALDIETLDDSGETSAENNSSAIVLIEVDDRYLLFTGDAGIPALTQVVDLLARVGFDFSKLGLVQVPHHGSQRNIGPTLLNTLLGPKLEQEITLRHAVVSVANTDDPKHPSKKVTNAFRRRGAPVYPTAGAHKRKHFNAPYRDGWEPASPLPLFSEVEE